MKKLGLNRGNWAALAAMLAAGGAAEVHWLIVAGGLFAVGLFLSIHSTILR